MVSLQEAVHLVSSDRAKERTDGLAMYRRIFGDHGAIEKVSGIESNGFGNNSQSSSTADGEGSEARWMRILQALFGCVVQERLDCIKKGTLRTATLPALRRLQDSASVVLFMVERACPYFSENVVSSVFNHLTQTSIVSSELVQPLGLPYLKALSTLLSYRPHLEHLDDDSWKRAVAICFSVALLRPITNRMWDAEIEIEIDEFDEDDRREIQRGMLRPEQVEAVNVLRVLLSSSYAPFLENGNAVAILGQYTQLLQLYPTEKSIHIDALTGLNHVIAALQSNDVEALVTFSQQTWTGILAFWNTKSRPLKEQIVMALGSLLPYARYGEHHDLISALCSRIIGEPQDRHALEPLRFSRARLARRTTEDAFQYHTVQLDTKFSFEAQLAWCVLELGADCLEALPPQADAEGALDSDSSWREVHTKRRKLTNGSSYAAASSGVASVGVRSLLSRSADANERSELWRKQLLLFYILRHRATSSEDLMREIVEALLRDASSSEGDSQAWTFAALAEVVDNPYFQAEASNMWQHLTRLMGRATSMRYATHLARAMVRKAVVPHGELLSGLDSIFADTCADTSHASDALCGLIVDVLHAARRDAALSRRNFPIAVRRWLQRLISREHDNGNMSLAMSSIDATDFASVCLAVTGLFNTASNEYEKATCYSGNIAEWLQAQRLRWPAEDFILRARHAKDDSSLLTAKKADDGKAQNAAKRFITPTEGEAKILQMFDSALTASEESTEKGSLQDLSSLSVAAILVHSSLHMKGVRVSTTIASTPAAILAQYLQRLDSESISAEETVNVVECLRSLLPIDPNVRSSIWSRAPMQHLLLAVEKVTWTLTKTSEYGPARKGANGKSTLGEEDWSSEPNGGTNSHSADAGCSKFTILRVCFALLAQSSLNSGCGKISDRMWEIALHGEASHACEMARILLNADDQLAEDFSISDDNLDIVLDWLGASLAQYSIRRDASLHAFAISFLRRSSGRWTASSTSSVQQKGMELSQHFIRLLKKQRLTITVERDLVQLLHQLQLCLHVKGRPEPATLPSQLRSHNIIRALVTLVSSPSAEVWMSASKSVARLVEPHTDDGEASYIVDTGWAEGLFQSLLDALPVSTNKLSRMACRVWTIGEVLVASSTQRHRALYFVIESVYGTERIRNHARVIIVQGAQKLGFSTSATLFEAFSAQLTWAMLSNSLDFGAVPFAVIGYDSREALVKLNFKPMASVLLAAATEESMRAFEVLCQLAQKTKRDALHGCSAFVFISDLTSCVDDGSHPSAALTKAGEILNHRLSDAKSKETWIKCINPTLPAVVIELLSRYYETDTAALIAKVKQDDTRVAARLASIQGEISAAVYEPCKPYSRGTTVYASLRALDHHTPAHTSTPSVIQGVLIGLTAKVVEQRFINDRIRLLQALQLFVAVTWDSIVSHKATLAQLLRSLAELLPQAELFDSVQTIFLQILAQVKEVIPTLSLILLRSAEAFQMHPGKSKDVKATSRAIRPVLRLEEQMTRLLSIEEVRVSIAAALAAWPGEFAEQWSAHLQHSTPLHIVKGICESRDIHAVVLQRLYSALRKAPGQDQRAFFSGHIWHMMEILRRTRSVALDADCCQCLGDILSLSADGLKRPEPVMSSANSKAADIVPSLRSSLASTVLDILYEGDAKSAMQAYDCLRGLLSVTQQFAGDSGSISAFRKAELSLISTFKMATTESSGRSREELISELQHERHDDNVETWSSWFVSLIFRLLGLGTKKHEYLCLATFAGESPAYAKTLLSASVRLFLRESTHTRGAEDVKVVSAYVTKILHAPMDSEEVCSALVALVLDLRKDRREPDSLSGDDWIQGIDYFSVAGRAVECGLFTSALLCLEIAKEHSAKKALSFRQRPAVLELQHTIYSNLEDPDIFYGAKNEDVRLSLLRRLEHEGRWSQVLELRAAEYETSGTDVDGVATAMRRQGFDTLAKQVQEASATDYEAAWRSQSWSIPPADLSIKGADLTSSQNLYGALRAIHLDPDAKSSAVAVGNCLAAQSQNVLRVDPERRRVANDAVLHFLCIQDALEWTQGVRFARPILSTSFDQLDFVTEVRLSVLQRRANIGQISLVASDDLDTIEQLSKEKASLLLRLSGAAREEGKLEAALKAITRAKSGTAASLRDFDAEFAHLLWAQGEHAIAIDALARIVASDEPRPTDDSRKLRARGMALARLGQWQATACALTATSIERDCFRPALATLQRSRDHAAYAEHCYTYATFAEEQYRILSSSDEIISLKTFITLREEEIKQLQELDRAGPRASASANHKVQRALETARKMVIFDRKHLATLENSKAQFRLQAGRLYADSLCSSDGERDVEAAVRLVSLLLEHAHDDAVIASLVTNARRVPSRKLIALTPQITSRLASPKPRTGTQGNPAQPSPFDTLISELCFAMARDHPFHALYSLYALSKGGKSDDVQTRRSSWASQSSRSKAETTDARSQAAADLILRVKTSAKRKERMQQWLHLCDSCVEWAGVNLPLAMPSIFGRGGKRSTRKTEQLQIPAHLRIVGLRNLDVPVPTRPLPIDATCQYDSFVGIARYSDRFTTAGGIHLPKIVYCVASDGRTDKQLFKDQDDLRQDAVMQQVFRLVNGLLERDRRATTRRLLMRTYIVVPLGPQCGMIEFVGDTVTFLKPLQDLYNRHAHKIEVQPAKARQELADAQTLPSRDKAAVYLSVCERMPPIFRYYFLERCPDPITYLGCRLNYSRSVATTSIVGHILGLGDRHTSNILLDERTGEVVHIDFGVAFDQGRLLPIPEMIPFRLTQNVIDGMGIDGVEGLFRRGCEETLRVLRQGSSVIKTVLEVFKYDPLYDWTQNPVKVIQGQANTIENSLQLSGATSFSTSVGSIGGQLPAARLMQARVSASNTANSSGDGGAQDKGKDVAELLAERAINGVMTKLSSQLSIEYTVNDLIKKARDPAHLGAIFHGWQAAL